MRLLNHPSIMKVFEVFETDNHINLILEILRGGELFERIIAKGCYSEREAASLMKKLLSALEHLHSKGIMHRDIKPENLILASKDDDNNIKLADFGLATYVNMQTQLFTRCGTPGYVAPEVLDDLPYNEKVDIFSAGIILYILLTGCSPFYGKSYNEILMKNKKCKISFDFTEFKAKPSPPATDLLKKMLEKDHTERISAADALTHEWIVSEGGRVNDALEVGDSKGVANAIDNMKKYQAEAKDRFNMMKLKPKDMQDDIKLVMKPALINGRTDTIEEGKTMTFDSPSFEPVGMHLRGGTKHDDLRKKAMLKHAESYSPVHNQLSMRK
jgi:serine/threonine protein kinase